MMISEEVQRTNVYIISRVAHGSLRSAVERSCGDKTKRHVLNLTEFQRKEHVVLEATFVSVARDSFRFEEEEQSQVMRRQGVGGGRYLYIILCN
jgi:hypothetical protein